MDTDNFNISRALTDWKNEPTVLALKADFIAAKPYHDSQQTKIDRWNNLHAVKGSAKPKSVPGRSAVQPKLIRKQAEWRYPALSEPFLSSQKLFSVAPTTFEDVKAAEQNETLLNYQFQNKINKVKFIDDYVRSAVDEGTVIVRLGWDREIIQVQKEVPVYSYYPLPHESALQEFQQALELRNADPRSFNEALSEELKAAVSFYDESGQATVAMLVGMEPATEDKILVNQPTVEVCNPANVYVDPSCNGDYTKALFIIYTFETNKATLQKQPDRYKNLNYVNWESAAPVANADHSSNTPDSFNFKDDARKKVVAYEYWGMYDIENDGVLVPVVATWIGDVMIRLERNPFPDECPPFIFATYTPEKRNLFGEPDAEILEDNQKVLGAVMRGMIDLLGRSANGQRGYAKNMLDPLNKRRYDRGEDYEFNPNMRPDQGIIEHTYPEIPASAMQMLNLQNIEAEAITGVKSFSGGLSGEAYGDVAAGIRGMLDAASKREMSILRRLANGIIDIGKKIIAMNAVFLSPQEVIRVTNKKFISINRDDLKGNFDLTVDISTAEIDNAQAQDLGFMLQTIGPNTDISIVMMILAKIARLKRMPDLAEKLENWKPTPDPIAQEKAQLELEELRSRIELNRAKAKQALEDADKKVLDFVEQETGTKHAREMERQQAQAQGNQQLEITKALTKPRKEGEQMPDIESAIGFNAISEAMMDRNNH